MNTDMGPGNSHGAIGNMDAQPTAPGANGPNGWPQHPVTESLYETCIATQGKIDSVPPLPGEHWSSCATHNMPAYPNGPCDCGAEIPVTEEMERVGRETLLSYGKTVGDMYCAMAAVAPRYDAHGRLAKSDLPWIQTIIDDRDAALRRANENSALLERTEIDRDAWSFRCAALMTELDKIAAVSAELSLMVVRMRKRAEAAEQRLSERDGPMRWLSSRNPPT